MTDTAIAAACLGGVALLSVVLIFDWARHDPKPASPVRLADRKTWRRKPKAIDGAWVHIVGMTALAVELYFLVPMLTDAG